MTNYHEKDLYIKPSMADANGLLAIDQIFTMFMDLADDHANSLGIGWKFMASKHLFWLTVKTKVNILERPKLGETVTISTWVDPPARLRSDRSYEMRQGDKVLVQAKTEWAILNTDTMKIINIAEVYPEDLDYSRPSACPGKFARVKDHFEEADKYAAYKVRSTEIDIGGHMNNVQYVRALLGTFSNKELKEMNPTSFDVIFRNSVFEVDALSFYKQPVGDGFDIRVARDEDNMTALLVHME